jgi:lipopolysaccharide export system permease protein
VILERMLLRILGRSLLVSGGVILLLGLLLDFLDTARHTLAGRLGAVEILLFYVCKAPVWLYLLLPLAVVIGVAVAYAELGRTRELRAAAAAGVSPARLARPALLLAALSFGGMFLLGEWAAPPALDRLERLMNENLGRIDSSWRFFRSHMWTAGDGQRLIRTSSRARDGHRLEGALALELGPDFSLRGRLEAREVIWDGRRWIARGVEERSFQSGRQTGWRSLEESSLDWSEGPERFRDLSGRPQQLGLAELGETATALERRGLTAQEHRLEWQARFARPLAGFGLVLLLLALAARPQRAHSLARAILEGGALGAGVYLLFAFGQSGVAGGWLPPALGAWLPAGLVLAAGGLAWWPWRTLRARSEP